MRVTHGDKEHLIQLSDEEASALVDACALLLLAARSAPECQLNPSMSQVLSGLFEQFSGHTV